MEQCCGDRKQEKQTRKDMGASYSSEGHSADLLSRADEWQLQTRKQGGCRARGYSEVRVRAGDVHEEIPRVGRCVPRAWRGG